jgi:hypothetical protein
VTVLETLNQWLRDNNGYVDGDDLEESVVPNIAPSEIKWIAPYYNNTDLSPSTLKTMLNDGHSVVSLTAFDMRLYWRFYRNTVAGSFKNLLRWCVRISNTIFSK